MSHFTDIKGAVMGQKARNSPGSATGRHCASALRRWVENVLPHRRADIEQELEANAVIFDAASFQIVSRPSEWWSDVKSESGNINQVLMWQPPACWEKGAVMPCGTAPREQGHDAPVNQ